MIEKLIEFLNTDFNNISEENFLITRMDYAVMIFLLEKDCFKKSVEFKDVWTANYLTDIQGWFREKIDVIIEHYKNGKDAVVFNKIESSMIFDASASMILHDGEIQFIGDERLNLVNLLLVIDFSKFRKCANCMRYIYQATKMERMYCGGTCGQSYRRKFVNKS